MRTYYLVIIILASIGFIVLGKSRTNSYEQYKEYLIDSTLDLHKDTLVLPTNHLIRFKPNGIIQNGVIIFPEGECFVEATAEQKRCIVIGDNTEVIINGNISLIPNDLIAYNILYLNGTNIVVKGKGTVSGDKFNHLSKDGEWGHGMQVSGNGKVYIKDVSIKNCWGDCIYIRGKEADVTIDRCKLDHGRRQGISITAASSVLVKNTIITNISGKSPQYAIDVEPNEGDTINNVIIKNVQIKDCKGGIVASSRSKNSQIGSVDVESCIVEGHVHRPYYFTTLNKVTIKKCKTGYGRFNIRYKNVKKFIQKNNKVVGFVNPVTQERD